MKQYLTKDQTQHLIGLGFPKPHSVINEQKVLEASPYAPIEFDYVYSIGELIEILNGHLLNIKTYPLLDLPMTYGVMFSRKPDSIGWKEIRGELIDKLYDACVQLKEENII